MAGEVQRIGTVSLIQLTVDENKRGRIMGNLFLLEQIASGIGAYAIGAIAVSSGLATPMFAMVALCTLAWLFVFTKRHTLRRAFPAS